MDDLTWLVCCDEERDVVQGKVLCPNLDRQSRATAVPVERCLDCPRLVATSGDRERPLMCLVEETS